MNKKNNNFADDILNQVFESPSFVFKENLEEIFERRLTELEISKTNVLDILKIQYRTLNAILKGTQKSVDFTSLIKLANFLQITKEEVVHLYIESLEKNFPNEVESSLSPEKIQFIKSNFDLAVLKKAKFINSITDFRHIEEKIVSYFSLNEIYDYKRLPIDVAFSAGKVKPKNGLSRSFWIAAANNIFEGINNPYNYDRESLVEFFPQIRWFSTNVELGLKNVMKALFKIGITVIYLPSFSSLHLRGATFAVNDKPCIVLTNYKDFYATIWFALIHELFHVLFDLEEIRDNIYHLSDEKVDQLSIMEREEEANNFAREYLFSKEKTFKVRPYLYDYKYVEEFAKNNHVHSSFLHVFNAYDIGDINRNAWAKARKHNPNFNDSIRSFDNSWDNPKPIFDLIKSINRTVYN